MRRLVLGLFTFTFGIEAVSILSLPVTPVQLTGLFVVLMVFLLLLSGEKIVLSRGEIQLLVLTGLFLAYMMSSVYRVADVDHFVAALRDLILAAVIVVAFEVGTRDIVDATAIMNGMLVGAVISALLGFQQLRDGSLMTFRMTGGVGQPNYFGSFLVVPTIYAFERALANSDWRGKLIFILAGLTTLGGILLSASRGAIISLVLVVPFFLTIRRVRFSRLAPWLALMAVAGVLIATRFDTILPRQLAYRFTISDLTQSQGAGRFQIWSYWIQAFLQNPLFGVGLGNAQHVAGLPYSFSEHNMYLGMLTEGGLVGEALFLVLLGVAAKSSLRALRQGQPESRVVSETILLGLLAFLCMGLVGGYGYRKAFWFVLVMACVLPRIAKADKGTIHDKVNGLGGQFQPQE